jgi:NAD(P)-dependent dehydrogenase (short-subunit alcohol dehydrogenase family)
MMLQSKTAIVYGAGPIGSAVAHALAREGARLFLAGRTLATLETLADSLPSTASGDATLSQVDATDQHAVATHAAMVADATGGIDLAFNATANDDVQGTPLIEMSLDDVIRPVLKAVTTHYLISTAVAQHMIPRHTGTILVMGGGREAIANLGGSHVAWTALAGLCRQLASELGPHGIRVSWLLSPGSPEPGSDHDQAADTSLLKHRPSYNEIGAVAAFLASDAARSMTATEINLTAGTVID